MGYSVGELSGFMEDVVYHAKGYMRYSRQERRKQAYKHRLSKLRARDRQEYRKRRALRLQGLPVINPMPKVTELTQDIAHMPAALLPQTAIHQAFWGSITREWQRCFKGDEAMEALLLEVSDGEVMGSGPQLLAEEMQAADFLDLDNVHPLFRYENFLNNTLLKTKLTGAQLSQAWQAMRPTFALATRFLFAPELQGFFYHLMYGIPATDLATKKTQLLYSDKEADLDTARSDFNAMLNAMAQRTSFLWVPSKLTDGTVAYAMNSPSFWSIMREYVPIRQYRNLIKQQPGYHGWMGISTDFLYHVLSPRSVARERLDADVRIHAQMAMTLVHELVHAMYSFRGIPCVQWHGGQPELFTFDTDIDNECGFSWENYVFNDVIIQGSLDFPTVGQLASKTWESIQLGDPYLWTAVPDVWLAGLFRKDVWRNISRHIEGLPKPLGKVIPHKNGKASAFTAQRWIESIQQLSVVDYVGGWAFWRGEWADDLNTREGQVTGDIGEWWRVVRKADIRKAVASGTWTKQPVPGPRGETQGYEISKVPNYDEALENALEWQELVEADVGFGGSDEEEEGDESEDEVYDEPLHSPGPGREFELITYKIM